MWTEHKRERLQQLRQPERVLTEAEQAELGSLLQELEATEAAYLAAATQRLRRERETVETKNRSLLAPIRRREALARRLEEFLTEARAERQAIERELAAVLAGDQGSESQR